VDTYRMTVRFEKTEDGLCEVTAWAHDRAPFRVSLMGGGRGPRTPHDLVTFVVERELGLAGGFFNLTAHGATFRSHGRRRTRPGRDLILANRSALDDAERTVHAHEDAWAAGRPTPAGSELAAAADRWRALAPGESFELDWPRLPLTARPSRRAERRPRRVGPARR
jgi:hypothetical protein